MLRFYVSFSYVYITDNDNTKFHKFTNINTYFVNRYTNEYMHINVTTKFLLILQCIEEQLYLSEVPTMIINFTLIYRNFISLVYFTDT